MSHFRSAVIIVVGAFCVTFGTLTFIEYRHMAAIVQRGEHLKFQPESAWIWAALHTTMIFGIIGIVAVIVAVLHSVWDLVRSRRSKPS